MKLINYKAFREAKILAFFKYWQLNTVEEIDIDGHLIPTDHLYPFISDLLSSYESNQSGYSLYFPHSKSNRNNDELLFTAGDERTFIKILNLIWRNPDNYFTIDEESLNKGGNYYDYFLKKLIVRYRLNSTDEQEEICFEYIQRHPEFIKVF